MVYIVGILTYTKYLKHRKYKSDETIIIRETKSKRALYNGYRTSKTDDGDYLFEKVNGIEILKKLSSENECMIFTLNGDNIFFADFKRESEKLKKINIQLTIFNILF